ncbi:MAG TPA: tetratricopeptide repeat protein [Phenylobacterium sp.]|nr:tetratricopeptide repeat protein [Phenylobacterium sp.]
MTKGILAAISGAAIVFCLAGEVSAATTVIGSSLAADCSQAARRGRADRGALTLCETALTEEALTRSDRAKTLINRGVILMRQQRWDQALNSLDQAIALQNNIGEAYVNRGAVLIGLRRYQEALQQIDHGLRLGVDEQAKAYYNRGLAHEGLEDAQSAYYDYQQAVVLEPNWDLPQQQLLRFTVTRR